MAARFIRDTMAKATPTINPSRALRIDGPDERLLRRHYRLSSVSRRRLRFFHARFSVISVVTRIAKR